MSYDISTGQQKSLSCCNVKFFCLLLVNLLFFASKVQSQSSNILLPSLNLKNSKNTSVFYVQEDGKIGIGLTSPAASLHVLGNDGMVFSGNFGSGIQLNPGAGVNMLWYPRKGAFRAGGVEGSQWDDKSIGVYSLATGYMTIASGDYSVALGTNSIASGQSSIAMGRNSISDNFFSTAIGFYASALGESSFSLGYHTLASGKYSFAMGYKASTNEHEGSFCFSDASSQRDMASEANNEMTMRFAGGYRLFSNKTASLGVLLNKESNSWASVLDSKKIENFAPVSAEDVLKKISFIKAGSFNFKGSGNKEKRHYGTSAQEFFRYFGKDTLGIVGSDTTISTSDFDGITLLALQGLEKRTTAVNSSLAQIDTLVQDLKNKDSLITKLKDDVDFLQNKMKEKEEEYQKLSEKLDLLEETINSLHGVKGRKPE